MQISDVIAVCEREAPRLTALGGWPAWFDGRKSLVSRVPTENQTAGGLDAGLACALGLIPEAKQSLAAILHGAYTEAAVEQVRRETAALDADSESAWWLSACSICREGGVSTSLFTQQIEEFTALTLDPVARLSAATRELDAMKKRFTLIGGIPFVIQDGGLQGAYILGHDWGVQYNEAYGLFFIGTFRPSLGLENFKFSDRKDEQGRAMSGPVHGSRQFVKVSTFGELADAIVECKLSLR